MWEALYGPISLGRGRYGLDAEMQSARGSVKRVSHTSMHSSLRHPDSGPMAATRPAFVSAVVFYLSAALDAWMTLFL